MFLLSYPILLLLSVFPTPIESHSWQVHSDNTIFHISKPISFVRQYESIGFHRREKEVISTLRSHDFVLRTDRGSIERTDLIGISHSCRFHPSIQNVLQCYLIPPNFIHDGIPFWLSDN